MKKLIMFVLCLASLGAYAQTQPSLPTGSVVYGNTYYLDPDGNVWAGSAARQYRNIGLKSYVDSVNTLGWSNTQIDSAISAQIADIPTPTLQEVTVAGNSTNQLIRTSGNGGYSNSKGLVFYQSGESGVISNIPAPENVKRSAILFTPQGGVKIATGIEGGSSYFTKVDIKPWVSDTAAAFSGRVQGDNGINDNDFVTLGQLKDTVENLPLTLQQVTDNGNVTTNIIKSSPAPINAEDLTNKEYVDSLGTGFGLSYNSGTGKFDWGTYTDLGGGFSQYSVAIPANSILGVGDINSSDPLIMIDNTTVGKQAVMRVGSTSDYVVFNVSGTDHSGKIHIVSSIEGSRKGLEFDGTDGVISYTGDYSDNFTDRSLVDKGFVDNTFLPLTGGTLSGLATIEASGIGKLDLKSTVATGSTAIRFLDNADAQKGYIGFASSVNDVFTVSNVLAQPISFRTNNLERMTIEGNGTITVPEVLNVGTSAGNPSPLRLTGSSATGNLFLPFFNNVGVRQGYIGWGDATTDMYITNDKSAAIRFRVNGSNEILTLGSSGGVSMNNGALSVVPAFTPGSLANAVQVGFESATTNSFIRGINSANSLSWVLRNYSASTVQLTLNEGGVNAAGAYTNTSDIRLKDTVDYDYTAVDSLNAISFTWKDQRDSGRVHVGYSAQEVKEVLPDAVYVETDEEGNEIENGILSVDHVQVLIAKMALLEKKVEELQQKIKTLEEKP